MAKEPPRPNDAWDEVRETIDGFRTLPQSFYPGAYPSTYTYPVRYEGPSPESFQQIDQTLGRDETLSLLKDAVASSRRDQIEPLGETAGKLMMTVDLSRKNIQMLPEEISHVIKRDVESLVLSYNEIWHLPYRFGECTTIKYLNLKGNRFKDFPKVVYKLPQLSILDLSRNKIARIPEDIRSMRALRVLSLMNNNLATLPFAIGNLETLKVVKLSGNPLNDTLHRIIDGVDVTPPLVASEGDTAKEVNVTRKIKKYVRAEAAALESGGESSSEGPLDTPRPLKRNPSLRFPVVPATSGSESASDLVSPRFSKSPIPTRSHYRVGSMQNNALQNATANMRRPGVAPLVIQSERNRSNSESVLQVTQSMKSKRMGIVTRKQSGLGTVDEKHANRTSNHYRGLSHASVLRDRQDFSNSNAEHSSSSPASPTEIERQRGNYIRRLSSLPEQKRKSQASNQNLNFTKGVLYSLLQVHSHISTLLPVVKEDHIEQLGLEEAWNNSSMHLDVLGTELERFESNENALNGLVGPFEKDIDKACKACIRAYQHVVRLLLQNVPRLVASSDPKYIRTLIILVYSSSVEAHNAWSITNVDIATGAAPKIQNSSIPTIREEEPKPPIRIATPTRERPNPSRRLRSETTIRSNRPPNHFVPPPDPHAAVPLYINGRSRSNSRTNTLTASATSSVANTPRSSESFLIPGTPLTQISNNIGLVPNYSDVDQDVHFETIYLAFSQSVEHGLRAVPLVSSQFSRCLDVAKSRYAGKDIQELWSRLISRSRFCLDMCEALKMRLSTIKLKEPEVRDTKDFWDLCLRFVGAFTKLVEGIKEAKELKLVPAEVPKILQPVHRSSKIALKNIENSPWAYVLKYPRPPNFGQTQWQDRGHANGVANGHMNGHMNGLFNGHVNGHYGRGLINTHQYRNRGGSGSSLSPYTTSVPATPLSAALGPAAQATMPSTPAATSARLEGSFQGDVFQRAEALLNMQQTMFYRR